MTTTRRRFVGLAAGTALTSLTACSTPATRPDDDPARNSTSSPNPTSPSKETTMSTIVLVHGAFADSSSWYGLTAALTGTGHTVTAYANPLRGVASDAAGLTTLVRSIDEPVTLVGHSYGGAVMTNVPADAGNIIGLVFVAAFALDAGESAADVSGSVPGSSLGDALHPVPLAGGATDLYISPDKYHHQFCADLPDEQAARMAISQRPITEAALGEKSGSAPLWRSAPSWFIFGDQDLNIPVQAQRNMAQRAGSTRTVEIPGASHVVAMSHPDETVDLIRQAAGNASR